MKDEADLVAPHLGEAGIVEEPDLPGTHERAARRRCIETGHTVHEGGLSRSRRTHHRGETPVLELDGDPVEGAHDRVTRAIGLHQVNGVCCRWRRDNSAHSLLLAGHAMSPCRSSVTGSSDESVAGTARPVPKLPVELSWSGSGPLPVRVVGSGRRAKHRFIDGYLVGP